MGNKYLSTKILRNQFRIRILAVLVILLANTFYLSAQNVDKISLKIDNATYPQIFKAIEKKTKYVFFYNDEISNQAQKFTVNESNLSIDELLKAILKNSDLTYKIMDEVIVVTKKSQTPEKSEKKTIRGSVTDAADKSPLIGATILEKGTLNGSITDVNGNFSFQILDPASAVIEISIIGYEKKIVAADGAGFMNISLAMAAKNLEEVVVIGYGMQKKRDIPQLIVNPQYRKLTHQLKKLREKIQRLEARFFPLIQLAIEQPLDDLPAITNKQMEYKEKIDSFKKQEDELKNQRSKIKPRLKVCQMPQQERYNKLKTESKLFMNVIKMICYRAESSVAQCIAPYLAKAENEKRMVVKQIIQTSADLTPDYDNKTLTITLHSLSAERFNNAADELAKFLNQTETIFPGTDLKMIFEITAKSDCAR